jgi:dienelactone hydrolase
MLQDYYVEIFKENEAQHTSRIYNLTTESEALAYCSEVREKIYACLGPLPDRSPLNAVTVRTHKRQGYRIENVIFESRPGFKITGNLYVPEGKTSTCPGVLGTCGHTDNGKIHEVYQSFAQGLVRKGYVVLLFDPIGQGERLQYPDDNSNSEIGIGVREHIYNGCQMLLTGESMPSWFAWDCIRGIDYLLTRPEVDENHIGVTGNSGGGTQSALLCALDDRLTMAAPSCYITSVRRNLENELVQDAEQCPIKFVEQGLDHFDFIAAMAPKPVILLSQEKDFFDIRGTEETFKKLQHLYELLGAKENIQLFTGDRDHGYHKPAREAMYGFFNKVTGIGGNSIEADLSIEEATALQCTESGQLGVNSHTVRGIIQEKANTLSGMRSLENKSALQQSVRNLLKLPEVITVPEYRILRNTENDRYPKREVANYLLETESHINVPIYRIGEVALYSRPPQGQSKAILYVPHFSSDLELREEPIIRAKLSEYSDRILYTCDLRGSGESASGVYISDYILFAGEYFYGTMANMLNHSLVAKKTFDLLSVIAWLGSIGHDDIYLIGKGWGSIPATFASLLSSYVSRVSLKNPLTSFDDIAKADKYHWPLSCFPPGVLQHFDLPDCYHYLQDKDLELIDPWNEMGGS